MKKDGITIKPHPFAISEIIKTTDLTIATLTLLIFGFMIILSPSLKSDVANAQTFDQVIDFPSVNVTDSKNQSYALDKEFIIVNNNQGNNSQTPMEVKNPDFSLNTPFVKLIGGQKYVVNAPNDQDIKYTNSTIKLAQVIFKSPDVKIQDADPESPDDITLGNRQDIAYSAGDKISFIVPPNLPAGDYILYVYLQYPSGITGVFSNWATTDTSNNNILLRGSSTGYTNNNFKDKSYNQGTDFRPICNTLQIAFYHSCSELVNPDGSLTPLGQGTVKCTLSGAAIGGIASFVLPPGVVIGGLNFLAGQTGCSGLVKLDLLNSIGNINGILNQLTRFIH